MSTATPARHTLLEARRLSKRFAAGRARAGVHAVEDVSLALAEGGITAIVGESGSGKSTLARVIAQLYQPSSGELLLDGEPVRGGRRHRRSYARQVQLVLQDPFASLNPVHDIRYQLSRPLKVHGLGAAANMDEALRGLLERVSLSPAGQYLPKYPHELSGGQRQRVAIARALAVRPRALLADEPVSMLDVSVRLGVLNLLADLRENEGMAILYITHDIASAHYLADEIAVMYAGRIVESGPAVTVTDAPAHPYTQLLLSAAPDPDRPSAPALTSRGSAPSLLAPPPGCRFHPRCPHAMAVCSRTAPTLFPVAPGHVSACWLHSPEHAPAPEHSPAAALRHSPAAALRHSPAAGDANPTPPPKET